MLIIKQKTDPVQLIQWKIRKMKEDKRKKERMVKAKECKQE